MNEERFEVLRMIESGQVSPEEGLRLLNVLDNGNSSAREDVAVGEPQAVAAASVEVVRAPAEETDTPNFSRWRFWSWVGFGVMVLLTGLSAIWMVQGWNNRPWGVGFWLAWIPFLFGVVGMVLTYDSPWLHIRIRQKPGSRPQKINISMPLPVRAAGWFMSTFSHWMPPKVREQNLGEVISELGKNFSSREPLHIRVDDEDGEQVEIFIG
ncbi:MAG: hypothetical protein AB1453_13880 [Chloroflexota bacterium]|jgi:hypothetical protein